MGDGSMQTWTALWIAITAMLLALPSPALAFERRAGKMVVFSETTQDDLYAAGGTVTVAGTVDGDVVAAGGTLDFDGRINGGVLAAGGMLSIRSLIGRALRAAGGTLTVAGPIGSDAVLAGGTVTVDRGAQIGRDLVVGGGNVTISGAVGRNAMVSGSNVILGGTVRGDTEVHGDRIVLLPTTRIGGRLRYTANQTIEIQPGAQVAGGTERIPVPARPRPITGWPISPQFWLGEHLAELLVLLVMGIVVFAVAPRPADAVTREVGERFGRSVLAGFLLLVAVPVAAFLALFTIIGIPLSVIAMLLYAATLYPGQVFVAAWLGAQIVKRVRRGAGSGPSAIWALVVGAIVLVLLFAIPFAGWAIRLIAVLTGFGALWVTMWHSAKSRPAASAAT